MNYEILLITIKKITMNYKKKSFKMTVIGNNT